MQLLSILITAATVLSTSTAHPHFHNHEASPENVSLSPEHFDPPLESKEIPESKVFNDFSSDVLQGDAVSVAWVDGKLLPVHDVFYLTPSGDEVPFIPDEMQPSESVQLPTTALKRSADSTSQDSDTSLTVTSLNVTNKSSADNISDQDSTSMANDQTHGKSSDDAISNVYKTSLDSPIMPSFNSTHKLENEIESTSNKSVVSEASSPTESTLSFLYENDDVYSLVVAAANAVPSLRPSKVSDSQSTTNNVMNTVQVNDGLSESESEVKNPDQTQIQYPNRLFEVASLENEVENALIVSNPEPIVHEKEKHPIITSSPSISIQSSLAVEPTLPISSPAMQTSEMQYSSNSPSVNIEPSKLLPTVVKNEPTPILPSSSAVPLTLFYHQFDAPNVEKSTGTYSGKNTLQPFQVTSSLDVPPTVSTTPQHTPTEIAPAIMDSYSSSKVSVPHSTVNVKLVDASEVQDLIYKNSIRKLLHPTAEPPPIENTIYNRAQLYERLEQLSTKRQKLKVHIEAPTTEEQTRVVKLRPVLSAAFVNPTKVNIGPTPTRCKAKKPRTILRTLVVTEDDVIGTYKDGVFKRRDLNIGTEWKSFSTTTIDRSTPPACPTIVSPRDAGLPEETVGVDGVKTRFGLVTSTALRTVTVFTASTRPQDVVLTHTEVVTRTLVSLRTRTVRRFGARCTARQGE